MTAGLTAGRRGAGNPQPRSRTGLKGVATRTPPPSARGRVSAERGGAALFPPPGGAGEERPRYGRRRCLTSLPRATKRHCWARTARYVLLLKFGLRGLSLAMESDFYLRYYVGHKGKFGHEFLEFEFRPDGESALGSGN